MNSAESGKQFIYLTIYLFIYLFTYIFASTNDLAILPESSFFEGTLIKCVFL